jgi:hypothetical protein
MFRKKGPQTIMQALVELDVGDDINKLMPLKMPDDSLPFIALRHL